MAERALPMAPSTASAAAAGGGGGGCGGGCGGGGRFCSVQRTAESTPYAGEPSASPSILGGSALGKSRQTIRPRSGASGETTGAGRTHKRLAIRLVERGSIDSDRGPTHSAGAACRLGRRRAPPSWAGCVGRAAGWRWLRPGSRRAPISSRASGAARGSPGEASTWARRETAQS
eukprot:1649365-Prymnesium_polylepis.1